MLFFVAIGYMHRQQSLLVPMAGQVQCVGFTVDQCLVASIQVRERAQSGLPLRDSSTSEILTMTLEALDALNDWTDHDGAG